MRERDGTREWVMRTHCWSFLLVLGILGIFLPLLTESSRGAVQLQAQKWSGWYGPLRRPLEHSPHFLPGRAVRTTGGISQAKGAPLSWEPQQCEVVFFCTQAQAPGLPVGLLITVSLSRGRQFYCFLPRVEEMLKSSGRAGDNIVFPFSCLNILFHNISFS